MILKCNDFCIRLVHYHRKYGGIKRRNDINQTFDICFVSRTMINDSRFSNQFCWFDLILLSVQCVFQFINPVTDAFMSFSCTHTAKSTGLIVESFGCGWPLSSIKASTDCSSSLLYSHWTMKKSSLSVSFLAFLWNEAVKENRRQSSGFHSILISMYFWL